MDDSRLLRQLADRTGVIDSVLRAARAMDVQDWAALRTCLAATLVRASRCTAIRF